MSNSFDFDIEDRCIDFIRDDSSQVHSDLFNNNGSVKVEEQSDQNF